MSFYLTSSVVLCCHEVLLSMTCFSPLSKLVSTFIAKLSVFVATDAAVVVFF